MTKVTSSATTTSISNDKFFETLELFFLTQGMSLEKSTNSDGRSRHRRRWQSNSIDEYEQGFERLMVVLKYIPDLTIALTTPVVQQNNLSMLDPKINDEIIKRNAVAKKIAEKHKLPVNDLYSLMINEPHRDFVHFPKDGSEKIARKVAKIMKLI